MPAPVRGSVGDFSHCCVPVHPINQLDRPMSPRPLKKSTAQGRIAMVAYTHYQTDPRCRREATLAAGADWDVHFYALSKDGKSQIQQVEGITLHELPMPRYRGASSSSYLLSYVRFFCWPLGPSKGITSDGALISSTSTRCRTSWLLLAFCPGCSAPRSSWTFTTSCPKST